MTCPRCRKGTLRMDTKSFQREEPAHARFRDDNESARYDVGRFKGFLRCSGKLCGEIVVVAGNFTTEYHDDYDYDTDTPITHKVTSYRPHVMSPAPEIIQYPIRLNDDSKEHLLRSFVLFWVDSAACANRLRIVTEYLLDQLKIPRKGPKGDDKNARLDLFDRIELLKAAKPGHEDALNALRSVGNVGSHDGIVDFDDLLTCYEAIEDTMSELIDETKAKLAQRIQDINTRNGKPKGKNA
ncbi:DUF4145 domain-containing protein [Rhizobium sp. CG4]|nr:DUF4145 domain-containing protein [Rhizobium sp. CG4]